MQKRAKKKPDLTIGLVLVEAAGQLFLNFHPGLDYSFTCHCSAMSGESVL